MHSVRACLPSRLSLWTPMSRFLHYAQFQYKGEQRVGILGENKDGPLIDLTDTDPSIPDNMKDVIKAGDYVAQKIRKAIKSPNCRMVSQNSIKLLPPIWPEKLLMIGLNYTGHCKEQNVKIPETPVVSAKLLNTIVAHGDDVVHSPETKELDWEVELAIVIGKTAKNVEESDAMDYVFGYTIANDISARDLQKHSNSKQWVLGKGLDTTCPLGPYIVDKHSIGDAHSLGIRCRVNGVTKQDASTSELVFNTQKLLAYITRFMTLNPGDTIITGTPAGVGFARNPQEFLKPGDVVECEIEGIGTLKNKVVAP